ncbi:MAG: SWIM zinc finger family protein [Abitibacteriaceae bacterium]|nr:SWIM zinc finger family protein [Abditibacteriaceae bacterium]
MAWDYYERHFPASTPRQAKGGIKAQTQRGAFGQSWWAKRWIGALESFNIGSRLDRGRSYARRGQVLSIDIEPGKVTAKVQGSRPQPYNVRLRVATLSREDCHKLAAALSSQVLYTAKLLAGEMPQDVEQTFIAAGLSLFPQSSGDLETECSCPDWSNPCKHVAAVYYLLGEEFDRDPFLLFKLRGIDREQLLTLLHEENEPEELSPADNLAAPAIKATNKRKASAPPTRKRTAKTSQRGSKQDELTPVGEPLSCDLTAFWQGASLPDDFLGAVQLPPFTAALPKRLGNFPFWRGNQRFQEVIEPLYTNAAQRSLSLLAGDVNESK